MAVLVGRVRFNQFGEITNMNINNHLENVISRYPNKEDIRWSDVILDVYKQFINENYPNHSRRWPIINGISNSQSIYLGGEYVVFLYKNSPFSSVSSFSYDQLSPNDIGFNEINSNNIEQVRKYFYSNLNLSLDDGIFILCRDLSNLSTEIKIICETHKQYMGLLPMKIFLSHKSKDKSNVREFKNILQKLGFSPWLDEEELKAGDKLNRSLLKGMQESCAAIFFITDNYEDTQYLSDEIDYAKNRAMEDPNFKIITLVFNNANHNIPQLLRHYVWKNVNSDLSALGHIIDALPLQVGEIRY